MQFMVRGLNLADDFSCVCPVNPQNTGKIFLMPALLSGAMTGAVSPHPIVPFPENIDKAQKNTMKCGRTIKRAFIDSKLPMKDLL